MATLATNVSFQCLGLDGKPLAGGKVYTYGAGTTTPKNTYTTHEGDVPNTNPVILDQNGKAKIFLGDGAYRMRVLDSNDALIDDIDQISRYVTQSEFATFQQSVQDGVDQLTEVREQIDVFVDTAIGNQKGYAGGIAPLGSDQKLDPIYIPELIESGIIPGAATNEKGVAKVATTAIAQAGVNDTDFITPKKLRSALNATGEAPISACRAWVKMDGVTGDIIEAFNISSAVVRSSGRYRVNFAVPMPTANYAVFGVCSRNALNSVNSIGLNTNDAQSIGFCEFTTNNGAGVTSVETITLGIFC